MSKQAFNILKIIIIFTKITIFVLLLLLMGIDFVIVLGINKYLLYLYGLIMLVCLFSFLGTMFSKIRKICYIVFILNFNIYIAMYNFNIEIKDAHGIDKCLDSGQGVWDYQEHRCRADCWHWSWEKGCMKK